jgi:replication-associated recombination protein RarA
MKTVWEEVGDSSILLITGSSGMGKSTLAQIMSKSVEADWLTLSVRHADALRAVRGIQECIWIINQTSREVGLIIDDLPWDEMDAGAINLLRVLSKITRSKPAHLIFTNQVAPNPTQLSGSGLSDVNIVVAPPMSVDEIKELCIKHSSENGPRATTWAKILNIHTSGHPQLVHASVLGLKNKPLPQNLWVFP